MIAKKEVINKMKQNVAKFEKFVSSVLAKLPQNLAFLGGGVLLLVLAFVAYRRTFPNPYMAPMLLVVGFSGVFFGVEGWVVVRVPRLRPWFSRLIILLGIAMLCLTIAMFIYDMMSQ